MMLPRRWIFYLLCLFGLYCLFLQLWINKLYLEASQQPESLSLDIHELRTQTLGVVLPFSTDDTILVVESLKRWPTKCSRTTLNSVDLILYFAGELPDEFERDLQVASYSTSCFRKTRIVSSELRLEAFFGENSVQELRSAQFYNIFLAPEVRTSFVDYDALTILSWDTIIAQDTTFEGLYSATFTTSEPFWVKGSRLAGTPFSENAASTEMWQLLDHVDGNAIYNNTDNEFSAFVNFTSHRWQLTRPYDVALWATISDYPYSWPLWQRYASKFVPDSLVSTVETRDEENEVAYVITPETLFLRRSRSAKDFEKGSDTFEQQSYGCQEACGYRENTGEEGAFSTVCDDTCVDDHPWKILRFNGYNCGAGDPSKYGESCRLCFEDQLAALDADQALADSNGSAWAPNDHVIMCETKRPPEAIDCPRECADNINMVCDSRCGYGSYGDWHCNWRSLGEKCRFCFRDINQARSADKIARQAGGRVIMCETHEPPPEKQEMERLAGIRNLVHDVELASFASTPPVDEVKPSPDVNPSATPFIGGVTHENICVFIPGYFEFFHEAKLTVDTIMEFMPGVKMVIATHPMDYHVFHRALAAPNADVSIVNDTRVAYASLEADEACGNEIQLIYYLGPGEVMSRPFTAKDTHSPKGDLLVRHTDANIPGGEHARRSIGTTALLGFHSPSFTYGADLILPAEINAQLRAVLREAINASDPTAYIQGCTEGDDFGTCEFHGFLDFVSSDHIAYASIFIPELLAALLFERNPMGVQFIDPRDPRHPSSRESTIWDESLVKPRFGCSIDLSLTLQGYDVARQLSKHVETFRNGAPCDRGFVAVDPTALNLKAEWEFPKGYPSNLMPSLRDFRISVMYRTFSGDLELFKISLPTAIKHIPDALEIVVVVVEVDRDIFEEVLAPLRESAPFPLRVVTEPALMDGHIQQKYSKMRADMYTEGDFILHLDSDVLVLIDVKYDDIFHFGKPVLPYRRHRDDYKEGRGLISCWQNSTSHAIGEDVMHEFSIFNTHVYPRSMYQALRNFVEEHHGKSFRDFMSTRVGKCQSPSKWPEEKRKRLLSDFNLMGAFLWYHMHDAVYWMPADSYDLRPDQFRVDLLKYNWVCQANGRFLPEDAAGKEQFKNDFLSVTNTPQCNAVVLQWRKRDMKNPETRTQIPRELWQ